VVLKITFRAVSFLFPGDITLGEEERLVKTYGDRLSATVVKVPHHGSYSSSSARFLRSVAPSVAVISCAQNNDFGHPHTSVLRRYRKTGAVVYRTDYQGSITVVTDGGTYSVSPSRGDRISR
jgi:competence protein ComEC